MNWLSIVMLSIGALIIISTIVILVISIVLEIIVNVKKKNSKELIPTETKGVYEVKHNVSPKLMKISASFLKYRPLAKFGLVFGSACASLPILRLMTTILFKWLTSFGMKVRWNIK